jgi:hypothetical protein
MTDISSFSNEVRRGNSILLKGKSEFGKSRIQLHGDEWIVEHVASVQGRPSINVRSKYRTLRLGEGTTLVHAYRWILFRNDPDFLYFY